MTGVKRRTLPYPPTLPAYPTLPYPTLPAYHTRLPYLPTLPCPSLPMRTSPPHQVSHVREAGQEAAMHPNGTRFLAGAELHATLPSSCLPSHQVSHVYEEAGHE